MGPGAELPITKRLEISGDFKEWYHEFTQWVYSLEPCVDHYLGGLIKTGKPDYQIRDHYADYSDEEITELTQTIDNAVRHVITQTVGNRVNCGAGDITKLMQLIIRFGFKYPFSTKVAELRSYAKSLKDLDNYRRHMLTYGSTDWILEVLARCINPAKYSERQLVKLLKHIDESDIDADYEAALVSGYANLYRRIEGVHEALWQMVKLKLNIKEGDKKQSRPGRKPDQNGNNEVVESGEIQEPDENKPLKKKTKKKKPRYLRRAFVFAAASEVHIVPDKNLLWEYKDIKATLSGLGLGGTAKAFAKGSMKVRYVDGTVVILNNVYYVPGAEYFYSEGSANRDGVCLFLGGATETRPLVNAATGAQVGSYGKEGRFELDIILPVNR